MKTLDDLNLIIKKLLTSHNEGDMRIGVEFLIKEELSNEEYLYLLPDIVVGCSNRDIKSNYIPRETINIQINENLFFNCNSSGWLTISEKIKK